MKVRDEAKKAAKRALKAKRSFSTFVTDMLYSYGLATSSQEMQHDSDA